LSNRHIRFKPDTVQWFLAFLLLFSLGYLLIKTTWSTPSANTVSFSDNNFYVLDLSIPANLDFCGEKIPSNNYEIRDDLKKEFFSSSYWKSNSMILFRRAQKWFPYIEPILQKEGVPDDFKYLAVIESHLSNITSPAGASGFWQLLPGSARNYGLEVNNEVDERFHVEKATHAACLHIKDAYKVFKNWTLSAAAYNRGIGGIISALRRQRTDNYFDLLLNRETGSFVYRILAYKTLFSSPGHFGIKKKKWAYFPKIPMKAVRVDSSIHNLEAFAAYAGTDKATLKAFNPWLLGDVLTNTSQKTYEIRIPKNQAADYSGYLADLRRGGIESLPLPEKSLLSEIKPGDTIAPAVLSGTLAPEVKSVYHVVKENESLKLLAEQYEVTTEQLMEWNGLSELKPAVKGQTLVIYYPPKK
jgi:membrane-bound lytic murein transglycosylase D